MNKVHWLAGFTALALWAGAAEPGRGFHVITEQTTCPEYGTVLYRRVLICEGLRLAFHPPTGWSATADAEKRTLVLEAPGADTQIRLRLILPQGNETNSPPQLPPAPEIKTVVAGIAPSAEITLMGEFPAPGVVGKSCDFAFVQGTRRYQGRVVWLTYPVCHLEVIMTTAGALAQKHHSFVELLNSLEVQALRASASANR